MVLKQSFAMWIDKGENVSMCVSCNKPVVKIKRKPEQVLKRNLGNRKKNWVSSLQLMYLSTLSRLYLPVLIYYTIIMLSSIEDIASRRLTFPWNIRDKEIAPVSLTCSLLVPLFSLNVILARTLTLACGCV